MTCLDQQIRARYEEIFSFEWRITMGLQDYLRFAALVKSGALACIRRDGNKTTITDLHQHAPNPT